MQRIRAGTGARGDGAVTSTCTQPWPSAFSSRLPTYQYGVRNQTIRDGLPTCGEVDGGVVVSACMLEEPDHSGRVAHLLVAHAVVDELALAPVGRGEAPW